MDSQSWVSSSCLSTPNITLLTQVAILNPKWLGPHEALLWSARTDVNSQNLLIYCKFEFSAQLPARLSTVACPAGSGTLWFGPGLGLTKELWCAQLTSAIPDPCWSPGTRTFSHMPLLEWLGYNHFFWPPCWPCFSSHLHWFMELNLGKHGPVQSVWLSPSLTSLNKQLCSWEYFGFCFLLLPPADRGPEFCWMFNDSSVSTRGKLLEEVFHRANGNWIRKWYKWPVCVSALRLLSSNLPFLSRSSSLAPSAPVCVLSSPPQTSFDEQPMS